MSATPTKDAIERALTHHAAQGRIKLWVRAPHQPWSGAPKWLVTLNPGAVYKGSEVAALVTYNEAELFCAALSSAQHTAIGG